MKAKRMSNPFSTLNEKQETRNKHLHKWLKLFFCVYNKANEIKMQKH